MEKHPAWFKKSLAPSDTLMAPIYDIRLKRTFLEFIPLELCSEEGLRKTSSCPCLLLDAPKSEAEERTDTMESLPEVVAAEVASTVSTHSTLRDRDIAEASSPTELSKASKASDAFAKTRATKTYLTMHIKLNGELVEASRYTNPDIFSLIRVKLHQMNAINLSTAVHRIAKLGGPCDQNETLVMNALLNGIEKQTRCELENHDRSMSAKSASIIAWSCASLQVSFVSCFVLLV